MDERVGITALVLLLLLTLAHRAHAGEVPNLANRQVVHRVQPVYPEIARRANLEGPVMIRAVVAADGHVRSVILVSGNAILAQAVMGAVKEWVFAPGVEEQVTVSIRFGHRD